MGVENKGKVDIGLSRRQLLKGLGVAALASGAGAALQACWPGGDSEPTIVDRVVTKEVEKIVTQNIVQQVPVDKVVVKEVVK
ncbi:MAG: twin-arginine translocation signal domain-containing protein, partial [Candidatus Blackburnbacteria bacterium]|nr:twin-arginine translocation signal domain-containing protein [Candidatus Blackburnbacteria bacterium]